MSHIIRQCKSFEINILQNYIKKNWRKNHIFVKNAKLLRWQHKAKSKLNFIVAHKKGDNNFDAVIGYITTGFFDKDLISDKILWLALWHSKKKFPGLGLKVYMYLVNKYKYFNIGGIGLNDYVKKIYLSLNFKFAYLSHFFIVNPFFKNYKIAKIKKKDNDYLPFDLTSYIKEVKNPKNYLTKNKNLFDNKYPKKSLFYFYKRYFFHPIYKYKLFSINLKNKKKLILFIARKDYFKKNSCLRIIDWFGQFPNINLRKDFQKILIENNCEYIDLICKVPNEKEISKIGFKKLNSKKEIIPHLFQPFLKKNVKVGYVVKANIKNYYVFKGDGDLDRPN